MIEFRNIILKVHQQLLLEEANLLIEPGNKVVLRGPSGCGKSSLLKCTAGALPLTAGSIVVDQKTLSPETVSEIRNRMAFIGQEPVLGAETVREALMLPFTYKAHRPNVPAEEQIIELLERLHLTAAILTKPSARISGGEKQRIAIIRALLLKKDIFLADEVTSALDPESRTAVMKELFNPEITLLSVSHDPEWAAACDRTIHIKNAQLREDPS